MIKLYKLVDVLIPEWIYGKRILCHWLVKTAVNRSLRKADRHISRIKRRV